MEPKAISVCCSGNCPTIQIHHPELGSPNATHPIVTITDDYNGSVALTPAEFEGLYAKYQELKLSFADALIPIPNPVA